MAEGVFVRNKARRRVIASYGEEPQRRAGRKAPRHDDLAYWDRFLVVEAHCLANGVEFNWRSDQTLQLLTRRLATAIYPFVTDSRGDHCLR